MSERYEIRQSDRANQVVRLRTEVLGTFADIEHARLFLQAIEGPGEKPGEGSDATAEPAPVKAEPETPAAARRAPAAPAPLPDKAPKPAPATVEPPAAPDAAADDADWEAALDRVEAGEKLAHVAADTGLAFTRLRARWAGAIGSGARTRPAQPAQDDNAADAPVSGGVGSVLARGLRRTWTSDQDAAICEAGEGDLPRLARSLGLSVEAIRQRRAVLEAQMARLMEG